MSAAKRASNIDVVRMICDILDRLEPPKNGARHHLISFVPDRPGHDRRYAIDPSKIEWELGWCATEKFEVGIEKTVQWYRNHQAWWRSILDEDFAREARRVSHVKAQIACRSSVFGSALVS